MEGERPRLDWLFISLVAILVGCLIFLGIKEGQRRNRIQETIKASALRIQQEEGPRKKLAREAYDLVKSEIESSLPRLILIGDEYAAGNQKGSVSFQLLRCIGEEVFSGLNERINLLIRQMNLTSLKIPVQNLGVLDESMAMILSRFGGNEFLLKEDLTITARGDPAPVDFTDESGDYLLVAKQLLCHFGTVTIGGVEGFIYFTGDRKDELHYQTAYRPWTAPGEELYFPAGTPVELETQTAYDEDVLILFFGNNKWNNGGKKSKKEETLEGEAAYRYVQGIRKILKERELPCVVLGRAKEGSELDLLYQRAFGEQYVRVTEKELTHLGQDDFAEMARQTYESLKRQGCFTSIEERVKEAMELWRKGI